MSRLPRTYKRELCLSLLAIALVVGYFLFFKPSLPKPVEEPQTLPEKRAYQVFVGNVEPFELSDLWVLSNPAGRDLEPILEFIRARSGGLHYIYRDYVKKQLGKTGKVKDEILFGIYMRIDSAGVFDSVSVTFTETKNASLAASVSKHIKENWRYKRAASKTELILPIRFKP